MAVQLSKGKTGSGIAHEPIQPQDLVMTLMGTYVRPHHETVWSGGLVVLLTELGFSKGSARAALTRLARRDLIARVRTGRLIHYRLTDRAERLLAEGDRRIFSLGQNPSPAHRWTMLWHEIPEQQRLERGRLARRLRFLGFGSLQDGLWISPHNRQEEVEPVLAELQISDRVGILVGALASSQGSKAIVGRAWDIESLCRRYAEFAERFREYGRKRGAPRLGDPEAFAIRTHMIHLYRGFSLLDPDLPDDLIGDPKARRKAVDVFNAAYARLEQPAQRHFDRITSSYR